MTTQITPTTRLISVIVPVRDGAKTLPACLEALAHQTLEAAQYEVIVVDDGSMDESASVAEAAGARVVRQPGAGPAAARNCGARQARGALLAFTDADCVPEPEWLANLVAAFENPRVVGARGCYRSRQPELIARFVQQEYQSKYDRLRPFQSINFVDTYSCAYRRDVFLAAGGFDAGFPAPSVEDQELSFRLDRQGHRLIFVPGAVVAHQHDRTPGEFIRRKFWIGYWKARLLRRHPDRTLRDSHTPFSQRLQVASLLPALGLSFAAIWLPPLVWLAWSLWSLFWLSSLPLLLKIGRHDPVVLTIAPLAVTGRALALGVGLALGTLRARA